MILSQFVKSGNSQRQAHNKLCWKAHASAAWCQFGLQSLAEFILFVGKTKCASRCRAVPGRVGSNRACVVTFRFPGRDARAAAGQEAAGEELAADRHKTSSPPTATRRRASMPMPKSNPKPKSKSNLPPNGTGHSIPCSTPSFCLAGTMTFTWSRRPRSKGSTQLATEATSDRKRRRASTRRFRR